MTLVVAASLSSILQSFQETEMNGDKEFDKLELRNRTVTETLSPVEDLGQDKKVVVFDDSYQRRYYFGESLGEGTC